MPNTISIGVRDWNLFPVSADYYPSDLPQEWRLSYFANEFHSACLNLDVFSCRQNLLYQWCEDLSDSFELSFKLNHIDQLEALTRLIGETGVCIKFLLLESSTVSKLMHKDIEQSLSGRAGITVISTSELWIPETQQLSDIRVAAFPASDSLRQYRHWIDAWLTALSPEMRDSELTLWLPGGEVDARLLEESRILVEMMGY